jgi:hypothetical protein
VYFSVITIGEISKGLSLLPSGQRREALETWLQKTLVEFLLDAPGLSDLDITRDDVDRNLDQTIQ